VTETLWLLLLLSCVLQLAEVDAIVLVCLVWVMLIVAMLYDVCCGSHFLHVEK
jgi:hypothetical protein